MIEPPRRRAWRHRFEWRVAALTLGLAVLAAGFGAWCIWTLSLSTLVRATLIGALMLCLIALTRSVLKTVNTPLRGLASVLEAYRGGDYTVRGSRSLRGDSLGDLVIEINTLGGTLHEQRLRAMEATALLDKLIGAIDVAVLAFDAERQLRVLNPAASRLLGVPEQLGAGRDAADLGLDALLSSAVGTQMVTSIGGRSGRWQVVHGTFREGGLVQHLLIISDLHHALREEERAAWQRLIRVIGHEVNNSLAPIRSMAESLQGFLVDLLKPGNERDEALNALRVIAERTTGLGRFLSQYSRLARLPGARPRWQLLSPVLARVVALEPLRRIALDVPADLEALVDADQLEQALINLAKNAVEAQQESGGRVVLQARAEGSDLFIAITDEGPGLANSDNLFVPFFTTKPGGSGVGLVLSRQIAEAHGGSLALENRTDRSGAIARLTFPNAARSPVRILV